jgi:hypothetical protein
MKKKKRAGRLKRTTLSETYASTSTNMHTHTHTHTYLYVYPRMDSQTLTFIHTLTHPVHSLSHSSYTTTVTTTTTTIAQKHTCLLCIPLIELHERVLDLAVVTTVAIVAEARFRLLTNAVAVAVTRALHNSGGDRVAHALTRRTHTEEVLAVQVPHEQGLVNHVTLRISHTMVSSFGEIV